MIVREETIEELRLEEVSAGKTLFLLLIILLLVFSVYEYLQECYFGPPSCVSPGSLILLAGAIFFWFIRRKLRPQIVVSFSKPDGSMTILREHHEGKPCTTYDIKDIEYAQLEPALKQPTFSLTEAQRLVVLLAEGYQPQKIVLAENLRTNLTTQECVNVINSWLKRFESTTK